jgi:hypothetical protein
MYVYVCDTPHEIQYKGIKYGTIEMKYKKVQEMKWTIWDMNT